MKTGRRCKSWTSKQQNGGHLETNNATQKEEVHEISSTQGRKTKNEYSSKMRYHTQIWLFINLKYFLIWIQTQVPQPEHIFSKSIFGKLLIT